MIKGRPDTLEEHMAHDDALENLRQFIVEIRGAGGPAQAELAGEYALYVAARALAANRGVHVARDVICTILADIADEVRS